MNGEKKEEWLDTGAYFERLNTIFHSIVAIPLLVFIFINLESRAGRLDPFIEDGSVLWAVMALLGLAWGLNLFMALKRYRQDLSEIRREPALSIRLDRFSKIALRRFVFFELSSVMAVIGLFLTQQTYFAILYIGSLIMVSLNRPSPRGVGKALDLKKEEQEILLKREPIKRIFGGNGRVN